MLTEETNKELKTAPANPEAEIANEESAPEETGKGNWRKAFLSAFQTARRQQKPVESRRNSGVTRANRFSCSWEFAWRCCCFF